MLYVLLNNPSDDSHCNISIFVNMCHNKGHFIFFPNGAAVVATVSNGVDAQFQPDENSSFVDVFHRSGIFSLYPTIFQIFFAGVAFHAFYICMDGERFWGISLDS